MMLPLFISAECFVHMAPTLLFKPKDNLTVDQLSKTVDQKKKCLITNVELTEIPRFSKPEGFMAADKGLEFFLDIVF